MKSRLTLLLLFQVLFLSAQSLKHPVIYTTPEERSQLLGTIEKYDWAKSMVGQLHQRVDAKLDVYVQNPKSVLDSIPPFATSDSENTESLASPLATGHNKILILASEAGMLYYLTEELKYARFAADILAVYIEAIYPKTAQTTTISGNAFFDPRTTYPHFALAYDFIYPYLKKEGATVYDKTTKKRILFENDKAQRALKNMVGNVLQEYGKPDIHGKTVSNHPILTAPGALFGILCIEDDTERERLFQMFWEKGTVHQNAFKNTILPMFTEQGLWPESLSYGFMPIISMVLNIVDRIKPEMEVATSSKHIFNGNFLYDYLRHPDRRFVRYGDSKRNNDFTANNYRYALHIAERRGFSDIKEKAQMALHQAYTTNGGYKAKIQVSSPFDNYNHLQLFWGLPLPEKLDDGINFNKKTVIVEHAGVALQRNYVKVNNALFGLNGVIGGAHYVHSHLTGISMELYGAGYVMAPNAGLPPTVRERQIPLHENYFRLYAGNNTVVVNGTSHGMDEGSWKGKANVWQNTVVNRAAEPKHLEDGVAEDFSFVTQSLNDSVNDVDQQRTLSTIRTSKTTGYYFDMFRSKSNDINKFHDYIYHNIGDKTFITDLDDKELSLKNTDRYKNDIGDVVKSPGWRYFENTETTDATTKAIKIRFDIEYDQRYMHLFVPNGVQREYTKALAPPTREAINGYVDKKTQVLVIRQQGEAWDRPYIGIFEPSTKTISSVQQVQPLMDGDKIVGAVVSSKIQDTLITDYIISQDSSNANYTNSTLDLQFKGRFAIVRKITKGNESEVILYIGEGSKLQFGNKELNTQKQQKGILY